MVLLLKGGVFKVVATDGDGRVVGYIEDEERQPPDFTVIVWAQVSLPLVQGNKQYCT